MDDQSSGGLRGQIHAYRIKGVIVYNSATPQTNNILKQNKQSHQFFYHSLSFMCSCVDYIRAKPLQFKLLLNKMEYNSFTHLSELNPIFCVGSN